MEILAIAARGAVEKGFVMCSEWMVGNRKLWKIFAVHSSLLSSVALDKIDLDYTCLATG
jgi:hypothetical protein